MGIVGTIITGIALFFTAVALVIGYILLIRYQRMMAARDASRTVPRKKIPTDWNTVMEETVIEKRKGKK